MEVTMMSRSTTRQSYVGVSCSVTPQAYTTAGALDVSYYENNNIDYINNDGVEYCYQIAEIM